MAYKGEGGNLGGGGEYVHYLYDDGIHEMTYFKYFWFIIYRLYFKKAIEHTHTHTYHPTIRIHTHTHTHTHTQNGHRFRGELT
jgi:hypothetical protein